MNRANQISEFCLFLKSVETLASSVLISSIYRSTVTQDNSEFQMTFCAATKLSL